ncbi:winged helix-turn-helix domain-containing protein [Phytohabitans kaempferiae]|uniref:HTH marR-type domain-containing protein n=1 Tax=Phytohabitans kaempferiae TaxID=1620943 RepID=A0ABV6MCP4_9ACTN
MRASIKSRTRTPYTKSSMGGTMDKPNTPDTSGDEPVEAVAAAIGRLGEATAAKIAEETGQGYSTVTARLRTLEAAGRAEKTRGADRRTYWRLPATPPAPAGTSHTIPAADGDVPEPLPEAGDTPTGANAPDNAPPTLAGGDTDTEDAPSTAEAPDQDTAAATAPAPTSTDSPADPPLNPTGTDTEATNNEQTSSDAAEPPPAEPTSTGEEPTAPSSTDSPATTSTAAGAAAKRRPPGHLAKVALSIMRANPTTVYTVTQMARLIDQADADHGYGKASAGAVVLALDNLTDAGQAERLTDKTAKFKLAPPGTPAAVSTQHTEPHA